MTARHPHKSKTTRQTGGFAFVRTYGKCEKVSGACPRAPNVSARSACMAGTNVPNPLRIYTVPPTQKGN